jgi:hypothetical protein
MVQVGSQKYTRIFLFRIFNTKIWLNQLIDDHHLGYITKFKKEKLLV